MVSSYRIRQSFSKTDAWLLRTSSLSDVFTLPANSAALFAGNVDIELNELVLNNHALVLQNLCRNLKLWYLAKIAYFCFRRIILYYSLGAETSGPGVVFFFAPNAHVHGPRVS